jgi:hypothetical protein
MPRLLQVFSVAFVGASSALLEWTGQSCRGRSACRKFDPETGRRRARRESVMPGMLPVNPCPGVGMYTFLHRERPTCLETIYTSV